MKTEKNHRLIYLVRNNYEEVKEWTEVDGTKYCEIKRYTSSLGTFGNLWKAYKAGRSKYLQFKDTIPNFHLELKVHMMNTTHYVGCSAFGINFERRYSKNEIIQIQTQIEEWSTWKTFESAIVR